MEEKIFFSLPEPNITIVEFQKEISDSIKTNIESQKIIYNSPYDQNVITSFSKDLNFYENQANSSEFDMFSPSLDSFETRNPSFHAYFEPNTFVLANPEANLYIKNKYDKYVLPLLEPFQTGIITLELYKYLHQYLKLSFSNNGIIFCTVHDYRQPMHFNPVSAEKNEEVYNISLKLGPDIIPYYIKTIDLTNSELEFQIEQELLLTQHPDLCLDPSLDVSRAQSILDYHKKSFIPNTFSQKTFNINFKISMNEDCKKQSNLKCQVNSYLPKVSEILDPADKQPILEAFAEQLSNII